MNKFFLNRMVRVITTGQHRGQYDLYTLERISEDHNEREYVNQSFTVMFSSKSSKVLHPQDFPYVGNPPYVLRTDTEIVQLTEDQFYDLQGPMMYGEVKRKALSSHFISINQLRPLAA
jgi:hypothetical protein